MRSTGKQILNFRVGLQGGTSKVEGGLCPACLGSDKSGGGAHGVLRAEVDIVLLLPIDPVGPWALPVQGGMYKRRHEGVTDGIQIRKL